MNYRPFSFCEFQLQAERFYGQENICKDDCGIQTAVLRVASSDGGFPVVALSVGRGPDLNVGDLVAWVPGEYREDLADASADSRFGWFGLIIGTLEPRYVACHPLMCR